MEKSDVKCPECGAVEVENIQKKGFRKNKREELQKYYCKKCGRNFVMKKMLNKSYPTNVILQSISFYNKGMTLENASKKINMKFGVKTYPRLISFWMKEFSDICTFRRIRGEIMEGKKPGFANPVFEKLIEHKQPYLYKYHALKIDLFLVDYFYGLKDYLRNVAEICPHELFLKDNMRSSQVKINYGSQKNKIEIERKNNYACKLAGLALKMARTNKQRHEIVQDFMLVNDTSTLAVEVPIWLNAREIEQINSEFGIFSDFCRSKSEKDAGGKDVERNNVEHNEGNVMNNITNNINKNNNIAQQNNIANDDNKNNKNINNTITNIHQTSTANITNIHQTSTIDNAITGHIDIVQIRFGLIYVLDYKPEAEKVDAISQLFTYALALSKRTDIWLRNFRCAWFDENGYYEFNPNDIILAHFNFNSNSQFLESELKKYVLNEKAKSYFTSLRFHEKYVKGKEADIKEKEDQALANPIREKTAIKNQALANPIREKTAIKNQALANSIKEKEERGKEIKYVKKMEEKGKNVVKEKEKDTEKLKDKWDEKKAKTSDKTETKKIEKMEKVTIFSRNKENDFFLRKMMEIKRK